MYCEKCGNQLPEDGVCKVCATREAVAAQQAQAQAQNPAQETYQSNPTPPNFNYNAPAVDPGKQQGQTALILGIVAIAMGTICSCLFACLGGIIPLVCAIISIVMANKAMQVSKQAGFKNSNAQIGMILSIVAIVVIVVFIIINAIIGAAVSSEFYY